MERIQSRSVFPFDRSTGPLRGRLLVLIAAGTVAIAGCGQRVDVGRAPADPTLEIGRVGGPGIAGGSVGDQQSAMASLGIPPVRQDAAAITWPQWAALLLPRVGAPLCANNVVTVVAWAAQENTDAAWNPLATTLPMPGSTPFNWADVQDYRSLEQGLAATVRTLEEGWTAYGYGPIVEALRRCDDPVVTAQAINASRWCLACARGTYVLGILPEVAAALTAGA